MSRGCNRIAPVFSLPRISRCSMSHCSSRSGFTFANHLLHLPRIQRTTGLRSEVMTGYTQDDLVAVGLDDAPDAGYVTEPGPAWLAPPASAKPELAPLEELPPVKSQWLDKLIFLDAQPGQSRKYQRCAACHDVLLHGQQSRNRRMCTSAVVVGGSQHGKTNSTGRRPDQTTILIDCGPTFYEAACKAWAAHDLRTIDAVLLTHGHADAVLGLDHLRAWTIGHAVQSHVDIYLSRTTYEVVSSMFPYLADPGKATGGGGVGALRWHIIDPQAGPFTITPIDPAKSPVTITPLSVAHGLAPDGSQFEFVGWRVGELSYVSDCNEIPAETAALMSGSVLVLDALKWNRHLSHYSIAQALQFSLQLANPLKSQAQSSDPPSASNPAPASSTNGTVAPADPLKLVLLTDFTHQIEHWSLTKQLHQWEEDMRLIAEVATEQVAKIAKEQGLEAAARYRDNLIRACPDVHSGGCAPPVARGAYANAVSSTNGTASTVANGARNCWWHPYWQENKSEAESSLATELADPSVRKRVQGLIHQRAGHDGAASVSSLAFSIPAFRAAYDQQVITFR